jgi:hypothetical protein
MNSVFEGRDPRNRENSHQALSHRQNRDPSVIDR